MFLKDLCIFLPQPSIIWYDKLNAIVLASKSIFHGCIKQVEVDYHFIYEKVLNCEIQIKFISSLEQCVDIFLMFSTTRFIFLHDKLMLISYFSISSFSQYLISYMVLESCFNNIMILLANPFRVGMHAKNSMMDILLRSNKTLNWSDVNLPPPPLDWKYLILEESKFYAMVLNLIKHEKTSYSSLSRKSLTDLEISSLKIT